MQPIFREKFIYVLSIFNGEPCARYTGKRGKLKGHKIFYRAFNLNSRFNQIVFEVKAFQSNSICERLYRYTVIILFIARYLLNRSSMPIKRAGLF